MTPKPSRPASDPPSPWEGLTAYSVQRFATPLPVWKTSFFPRPTSRGLEPGVSGACLAQALCQTAVSSLHG